jgi:cytochrome c oxidase subunit IV
MRRIQVKSNEHLAPTAESLDRSSIIVWLWLVGLLAAGMLVFLLPIPQIPTLLLIFGIAACKAILVLRDYMHLAGETLLIYAIVLTPVSLAIALALVLIPDIVFHR